MELEKIGSRAGSRTGRRLRSNEPLEPRWVEGKDKEGWKGEENLSDHDSGKHSDNSLSQSDNWSIRKESTSRRNNNANRLEKGETEAGNMAGWKLDEKADMTGDKVEGRDETRDGRISPGGVQLYTGKDMYTLEYIHLYTKEYI